MKYQERGEQQFSRKCHRLKKIGALPGDRKFAQHYISLHLLWLTFDIYFTKKTEKKGPCFAKSGGRVIIGYIQRKESVLVHRMLM